MTTRITISIPDDLADEVDSQLSYGDSRSAWIEQAIRERLEREASGSEGKSTTTAVTAD
jgi:metal-responsive CopG/Arc/MetJ family transcriptional regulator